ncbi:MAG: F0F1 ATP synthase subunit A, partial [Bacteroidales bacterium]|nr:F0F1 ATP synthase subunit A [Bacteroidales bacterium]
SKEKGIVTFMSNKLHNDEHNYEGFFINEEKGIYKGKIMETLSDGSIVRPFDISITKNVLALLMVSIFLVWIFISTANRYRKNPDKAPKGIQSLIEPLILFIRDDIAKASIGKKYEKYMPFLLTVFFFIFINNLLGIIPIFPGGYNLTGNITVTMVLALFTLVITTFSGSKHYWKHIFWSPVVPWWLKAPIPLMPIVEILGVITKPFVLMVRLFANIIGGHIVMLAFFSLIFIFGAMSIGAGLGVSVLSIAFTIFDTLLELLVAFIQAYVFTLLSAIYFGLALENDH